MKTAPRRVLKGARCTDFDGINGVKNQFAVHAASQVDDDVSHCVSDLLYDLLLKFELVRPETGVRITNMDVNDRSS